MTTTILPDDRCPACGKELDAAAPTKGNTRDVPVPGDISLCFGCGEVLWFDAQMKHQVLPAERLAAFDDDFREFLRVGQEQIRALQARRAVARI